MKSFEKSILFIIIAAIFGVLMMLGGCEEYIIENTIDTVYIERPGVAPTFITVRDTIHTVDTVEVKVIVVDTVILNTHTVDTLIQYVTKDSVIIREVEKVIHHTDTVKITIVETDTIINEIEVVRIDTVIRNVIQHDTVTLTVYDRTTIYHDTLYLLLGGVGFNYVPEEFQGIVAQFHKDAASYGKTTVGGNMIIGYWIAEEFPPANRSSYSVMLGVLFIKVKDTLHPNHCYTPLYRELARNLLGKPYSHDPNDIMSPEFDPIRLTMNSADKKAYLDKLFED